MSSQQLKRQSTKNIDKNLASPAKQIKKISDAHNGMVTIGNTTIPTHNNTVSKHNRNIASLEAQSLTDRIQVKQQTLMNDPPSLD